MARCFLFQCFILFVHFDVSFGYVVVMTNRPASARRPLSSIGNKDEENELTDLLTTTSDEISTSITPHSTTATASLKDERRRALIINAVAAGLLVSSGVAAAQLYHSQIDTPSGFRRISPVKFLAVLGDPTANSGSNANQWGIWKVDPGPRGVWLRDYATTLRDSNNGIAPAGWKFDINDWWLEEHGLIMESPTFPAPVGRYLVTGGRTVTTGLTIDSNGQWKLDEGTLLDVTHLPCRSARYHPITAMGGASPASAQPSDFPVLPGASMPNVAGCDKQDYAVIFVVGKAS